jgi:hypothetical protein
MTTCLVLARPSFSTPRLLITVGDEVARFRIQPRVPLTMHSDTEQRRISFDCSESCRTCKIVA